MLLDIFSLHFSKAMYIFREYLEKGQWGFIVYAVEKLVRVKEVVYILRNMENARIHDTATIGILLINRFMQCRPI